MSRPVDPATQLAQRLIQDAGATGGGLLYRENIATYLYHSLGQDGIRDLLDSTAPVTLQDVRDHLQPHVAARWMKKLERDLPNPYSDREVFDNLSKLESRFRDEVLHLQQWSGEHSCHILVNGSLPKGRMGKGSDIDAVVQVEDAAFREQLLQHFGPLHAQNISIYALQTDPGQRPLEQAMLGPRLDLGDGTPLVQNPHFLTDSYVGLLQRRGWDVSRGADGVPVVTGRSEAPPRRRELPLTIEMFWEQARQARTPTARGLKAITASLLYHSLQTPLLGPVVRHFVERLVPIE
ncbi:MAG: hypothetical protein ACYCW6_26595 [Candidatus Xenobia bacterium]